MENFEFSYIELIRIRDFIDGYCEYLFNQARLCDGNDDIEEYTKVMDRFFTFFKLYHLMQDAIRKSEDDEDAKKRS